MAEGRGQAEWGRTSSLMALVANVNRDPKKHAAFTPDNFNPYGDDGRRGGGGRGGGTRITADTIDLLRLVFVKGAQ